MNEIDTRETMDVAILTLVTGKGNVRERVWQSYLKLQPLKESDFPDELKIKWSVLQEKLFAYNNETVEIHHLINHLPLDKCIQIAELINDLDVEINLNYDAQLMT
jgi:hypothetical protein